jgi:hypothetical protein
MRVLAIINATANIPRYGKEKINALNIIIPSGRDII